MNLHNRITGILNLKRCVQNYNNSWFRNITSLYVYYSPVDTLSLLALRDFSCEISGHFFFWMQLDKFHIQMVSVSDASSCAAPRNLSSCISFHNTNKRNVFHLSCNRKEKLKNLKKIFLKQKKLITIKKVDNSNIRSKRR